MTAAESFRRISDLFHAALVVPAGPERDRFLAEHAAEPKEVLTEVRALLHAHEHEEIAVREAGRSRAYRFGAWETIRLLGSGGMGAVYLARRIDGEFDQLAAIKIVNPACAGGMFEQRFRSERQILASLQHPNITRLLDGGVEHGQPFLVMEYVDGEPLDVYCKSHDLPASERVRLFLPICAAVAYAHRHLVVHRDLKPSNILADKDGVPHLLDFGTAKLLDSGADLTVAGYHPLTPRYASPEQLAAKPIGLASDQFSLALILYELLTGRSAADRGAQVPGDLGTIVEKALEDDPARRYGSIDAFSADLERWLDGRPILARPQTLSYRAGKFLRRHWLASSLAVAALVLAVVGIVAVVRSRATAERRFEDVRALARYVLLELDDAAAQLPGSTAMRASMAERSMRYLDALSAQARNHTSLQLELAEGYLKLGNIYGNLFRDNLGRPDLARIAFQKGLDTVQQVLRDDFGNHEARRVLGRLEMYRGLMESMASLSNDDVTRAARAVDTFRQLVREGPESAEDHFQLGRSLMLLGTIKQQKGGLVISSDQSGEEWTAARTHLGRALELAPANVEYRLTSADLHERIAIAKGTVAPALALAEHDRAEAIFAALPSEVPNSAPRRHWLARVWLNRAWSLGQAQQFPEAFQYLERAEPVLTQLSVVDPGNRRLWYDRTAMYRAWGIVENYAGRKREAIRRFGRGIALYDANPDMTDQLRFLRNELVMRVAALHDSLGEKDRAAAMARQAVAVLTGLCDRSNPATNHLITLSQLLSGSVTAHVKDPARAVAYAQRAVELLPKDIVTQETLADALHSAGRHREAVGALEKAVALSPVPAAVQPNSRSRQGLLAKLGTYRREAGL